MSSKIFRFLPYKYRTNTTAAGYAEALATPMDAVRTFIARLPVYLTPESMPETWLGWMGRALGLPTSLDLPVDRQRQMIRVAINTWVHKGPAARIENYVRAVAGIESSVVTLPPQAFIAGINMAGDVCGIIGWLFEVHVPTDSIDEAELRRLLVPVVPVFCSYTVVFE